ncbi:MAG: antitoxin [Pseudomonadota bacterium]
MRTTVTLDPDVQVLLRRAMRQRDKSFKQALNDAVRSGLGGAAPARGGAERYDFPVFRMGRPLVDLTQATALAAELEDQELAARMQRGP